MADHEIRRNFIREIAAKLDVPFDDVHAVMYGEKPVSSQKLLQIMYALSDDGHGGVVVCAVWKGEPIPNAVRNLPRYDYFGQILEGLNLYLHKKTYTSQLLVSNFQLADYAYFEEIIAQHPGVGLINFASHFTGNLQKACEQHRRPLVFLDYATTADTANQYIITMKSEPVIAEVVVYLYGLGHRRIAFIRGPQEKQTAVDRYQGYCAGLAALGLEFDEALVFTGNWDESLGKAAAAQFLALDSPATAIIASNDLMAFGAMKAVEESGLRIPQDVSVVGYDDIALASMTHPPLTSVRTPMTQMGSKAGELIVSLLEGESPEPKHIYVPVELVIRASTGPAPFAS